MARSSASAFCSTRSTATPAARFVSARRSNTVSVITGDSPSEDRYAIAGKLEGSAGKYKVSFISGSVFEGELKGGKLEGTLQTQAEKLPLVLERKTAEKK